MPDPARFVSWCPFCGHMTATDGWGMAVGNNAVEWFCDDCGASKGSIAFDDLPRTAQDIIMRFINERKGEQ